MAPMTHPVHPDVLVLADMLLAEWPAVRERIRASGHPTNDGDDAATAAAAAADAAKAASADDDDTAKPPAKTDDADDADDDDGKVKPGDDWRAKARKHERDAKKLREENEALKAAQAEADKAKMSEHELALAKAREDATAEVTTKFEAQQRTDRIENAVTKLALRGFKAKDGDKEVTLKFADPDDAQLRLDRALRNDEIAYDDIYADGKVRTDAVTAFLTELLEEHPRLRAQDGNGNGGGKKVDFDAGKGSGSGRKDLESMSPDDHLKEIQGRK